MEENQDQSRRFIAIDLASDYVALSGALAFAATMPRPSREKAQSTETANEKLEKPPMTRQQRRHAERRQAKERRKALSRTFKVLRNT